MRWHEDIFVGNGSTTIFITSYDFSEDSVEVFINGLRQYKGPAYDYTVFAPQRKITFNTAPVNGALILIRYLT